MPGNYERGVAELIAGGWLSFPRGTLAQLVVSHDDDCTAMSGGSTCDCDPEFAVEVLDLTTRGQA